MFSGDDWDTSTPSLPPQHLPKGLLLQALARLKPAGVYLNRGNSNRD
jgi:hypothetical protein